MSYPYKLIVDVGAGMWQSYSEKLRSNKYLTIIAFEPHPQLFQKLNNLKSKWIKHDRTLESRFILSDKAVYHKSLKNVNFYLINDSVASSLSKLVTDGIKKWKYPFGRSRFRVKNTKKINTISLSDFFANHTSSNLGIDLLHIDIQGDCESVLRGIDQNLYRKIKRITIKVIDIPFALYNPQSDVVDIIDHLKINNFTLIRGTQYSRNQEQLLEFVNTGFSRSKGYDLNPIMILDEDGKIVIQFK